jgi:hypothetical protein
MMIIQEPESKFESHNQKIFLPYDQVRTHASKQASKDTIFSPSRNRILLPLLPLLPPIPSLEKRVYVRLCLVPPFFIISSTP